MGTVPNDRVTGESDMPDLNSIYIKKKVKRMSKQTGLQHCWSVYTYSGSVAMDYKDHEVIFTLIELFSDYIIKSLLQDIGIS